MHVHLVWIANVWNTTHTHTRDSRFSEDSCWDLGTQICYTSLVTSWFMVSSVISELVPEVLWLSWRTRHCNVTPAPLFLCSVSRSLSFSLSLSCLSYFHQNIALLCHYISLAVTVILSLCLSFPAPFLSHMHSDPKEQNLGAKNRWDYFISKRKRLLSEDNEDLNKA